MKRIEITVTLDCRDDVPPHIIDWMAQTLRRFAQSEFRDDYEPGFVHPTYAGPPLAEGGQAFTEVTSLPASN